MPFTYLLYSTQLDKYYVGHTEMTVEERLKKHLTNHKGFTGQAKDWKVVWCREYELKQDAYSM